MKNKSRKSKKLLVVVAVVLMLGLVVGMGAMTYSKYVTSGTTGTQTATAAKWGFVVTVNANDLFATDYTKLGDATLATKATATGTGVAVHASSTANVVAPGTTGSMTITISGRAEVLAQLTIKLDGSSSDIYCDTYHPVKWTLTKQGVTTTTIVENETLEGLNTALASMDDTKFTPGTDTDITAIYTLTWKWDLANSEADANVKDTVIGYKAFGKFSYADISGKYVGSTLISDKISEAVYNNISTQMSFNLLVSVEQIQA